MTKLKKLIRVKKMDKCPKVEPRELFDDEYPEGYMESDNDFIRHNVEAAVWLLENELKKEKINVIHDRNL